MLFGRQVEIYSVEGKERRAPGKILRAVTQVHYSYLKNARVCGLGSDNLVSVPCDAGGAILPAGAWACISNIIDAVGLSCGVGCTSGNISLWCQRRVSD